MQEIVGDLWEAHALGHWVVITTNPIINAKGELVMGRGVALQAAKKFPALPKKIAGVIKSWGHRVTAFSGERIIIFPVKQHWRDPADLELIERSAQQLQGPLLNAFVTYPVYIVRPGCGNGGLSWDVVKPVIAPILDDRFIVVHKA